MVFYNCEKCGKQFNQKGHYTKHINKKLPPKRQYYFKIAPVSFQETTLS